MRVALLGEFSGVHKYLKEGLRNLGHEAIVVAGGDGFKKIEADVPIEAILSGKFGDVERLIGGVERLIRLTYQVSNLKYVDVCQLVNPFYFSSYPQLNSFLISAARRSANGFFLLAAGSDAFFWKHGRQKLKAGLFDDFLRFDLKKKFSPLDSKRAYAVNMMAADSSDGIIPVMYEYEVSYIDHPKRLNTIPLPVNTETIKYEENIIGKKLVVFHGLNRYGFKGTRLVEEAFSILRDRYPNDLDLVIDGKMPQDEYLKVMARTNVVLDQMYSHSLGMNGIQALAMGKIVLGGVEPESLRSIGVDTSPAIALSPSVLSVVQAVENLLETRDTLTERGFQGRIFAEQVHGHIKVAGQYVETWKNAMM